MLKIYLDNCCYNRPYDDLSQIAVSLEANAKLHIQYLIKYGVIDLVYSYMSLYEIEQNPYEFKKAHILEFLENATEYVSQEYSEKILEKSEIIMESGIKFADAAHLASAIFSKCDYFITTDKRLLKYKTSEINLVNPIEFVKMWGENHDR